MTYHYQETDATLSFPLPRPVRFPIEPANETIGRSVSGFPTSVPHIVKQARAKLRQIDSQAIAKEADRLLSTIQEAMASFQRPGFDLDRLPPLQVFLVEDGSVLVEWIFEDFRIGFGLDPNPEDSSWYLVATERLGQINAYGRMFGVCLEKLVAWLMRFALSQS